MDIDIITCLAILKNKNKCVRKRKKDSIYCCLHAKKYANEDIDTNTNTNTNTNVKEQKKTKENKTKTKAMNQLDINIQSIQVKGIYYFVDNNGNIYEPVNMLDIRANTHVLTKEEKMNKLYIIGHYNEKNNSIQLD